MERGVVIGGVLIAVSLLLAVVLNSYAHRDAVVAPVAQPVHGSVHATSLNPCAVTGAAANNQASTPCTSELRETPPAK